MQCSKGCFYNSVGAVSPLLASCFTSQWESALNPLSTLGLLVFLWKEHLKKL